ncbi:tetratricopeptide repeat protein [Pontibacter sp. KCTC 32443]|uniref:tetratricopeptide repeat protein n=1 Tax=Pontibacter TaxID=323449 RepID=UPI00164D73CA|nr:MULTISPECIES: tetratricopeptide repeat protein [Pontibacter]MBC5774908.1 tetratricopeptide repeat protein [Pontibacter sp. KCTC 32443]
MPCYKKKSLSLLPYVLLIGLVTSSCTLQKMVRLAKKQEITVQPTPLVANGQLVEFEIKAAMPPKLIKDGYRYKLDVYYEYGDQQREQIGALNFEFGEFLYENGRPIIVKQFSFPYTPKKNKGKLFVQGMAIEKETDDVKYSEPKQIATGLVTTPLLMVRNNEILFIPDNYASEADKPALLTFYFEENNAKLRSHLGSNLAVLDQYIADNIKTQEVTITASQAPDETKEMAQKRLAALESYYRSKLDILNYTNKKVTIKTLPVKSTWEQLVTKIKASALPKAVIQEVTTIANSKLSDKEKNEALQKTEANEYLQLYVYPALRFAEVTINYSRDKKADYQLYLLAKQIAEEKAPADALTEQELQHAATLTPLLAEKKQIYEAAVKTTNKWPAYHNLGKVYVEMARKEYRTKAKQALLAKAIHNLTYAGFRNPTAPVYYSLASAYHVRGDKLEALQYYDYAIKLGGNPEELKRIFADKAALEIEIGQFDDAIESLKYSGNSYQTQMNLGLSYLLKENYEGAQEFYNKALELQPNDALANYSLAVIAARTKNEQMLTTHLRQSIKADNSYTLKAIEDMEFDAYREQQAYKDAFRQ